MKVYTSLTPSYIVTRNSKKPVAAELARYQGLNNKENLLSHYYLPISFGVANHDNLDTLYNEYKQTDETGNSRAPKRFIEYLESMPKEARTSEDNVYKHYKDVFKGIEDAYTVEELNQQFSDLFQRPVVSAFDEKAPKVRNNAFIQTILKESEKAKKANIPFFDEGDNDFSVYLAKKIFYELKTIEEIESELRESVLSKFYSPQKLESNKRFIPQNYLDGLGLTTNVQYSGFRRSMSTSRAEYEEKLGTISQKAAKTKAKKATREFVEKGEITSIDLCGRSQQSENIRLMMIYAWNNSFDLKARLSDFLEEHLALDAENKLPELRLWNEPSEQLVLSKDTSKATRMSYLMQQFWAENEELKDEFFEKCEEGYDIVVKSRMDEDSFEHIKSTIYEDQKMQKEKLEIYKVAKRQMMDSFEELHKKLVQENVVLTSNSLVELKKTYRTLALELCKKVVTGENIDEEFGKLLSDIKKACTYSSIEAASKILNGSREEFGGTDKRLTHDIMAKISAKYINFITKNIGSINMDPTIVSLLSLDTKKFIVLQVFKQFLQCVNETIDSEKKLSAGSTLKNRQYIGRLNNSFSSHFVPSCIKSSEELAYFGMLVDDILSSKDYNWGEVKEQFEITLKKHLAQIKIR